MQPGRGSQWTIKLPSSDYLLPTATGGRHGKGPKAGSGGEAPPWTALHGYVQVMCRDKRPGSAPPSQHPQQQQQHRHKHRGAPGTTSPAAAATLADVVTAGAYYAAAASPGAATAATALYWQQQQLQQPQPDEAYGPYHGTTADAFIFQQQISSIVPWREVRTKNGCFTMRQSMCPDAFYAPCDDTGFAAQQELHSFYPFQHQEHQQQQEWAQNSYLPYDDDDLGASGQGDGDAPVYGGGADGGVPEDFDLLQEEQDEVVAMLIEVDKRHEKHLAFERVLQKGQASHRRNKWRAPPSQLQLQRERFMNAAGSSDSVDVCVDASLWRSLSDSNIYDTVRSERSYRPSSTKIQIRAWPGCCNSERAAADVDKNGATVRVADSPPPPRSETPSPTIVTVATSSACSSNDCTEAAQKTAEERAEKAPEKIPVKTHEKAPVKAQEKATSAKKTRDEDASQVDHVPAEPKGGKEEVRNKEKASSSSQSFRPPQSSWHPVKESTSVTSTTRCRHQQLQQPDDALAVQQRKGHDVKRPPRPRREYHSTRRYDPDHATQPLMGKAPGAARQLKTDSPLAQKDHCKEPAGDNRRVSPSDSICARGQQQPTRGGNHSSNRNRNRSNRHSNGHNQWNKDRTRPDMPDGGHRGGGAAANHSPAPYCCQKMSGASRLKNPADAHTPTPPLPPPPSRGRHYGSKQNTGCGPTQARRQFSNTGSGTQPGTPTAAASATPRAASACNNTNRPPNQRNKAPATGDTPYPSRRSRRQQQQHKQRPDYNQPHNNRANAPAAETSQRPGSRDSLPSAARGGGANGSSEDGGLADDSSRRRSMSLKGLMEKTDLHNLTISRRRPSQ